MIAALAVLGITSAAACVGVASWPGPLDVPFRTFVFGLTGGAALAFLFAIGVAALADC